MYPFFTYHTCAVTQVGSTSTAGPNLKYACSQPAFVAHRDVVVVTNAQLHPTKSELRLSAGSSPARHVSENQDGEGGISDNGPGRK